MRTDNRVVLIVVVTLAVVVVTAFASMVGLTVAHTSVPDAIPHAFDLALGALVALLAKTSTATDDLNALAAATPPSDSGK